MKRWALWQWALVAVFVLFVGAEALVYAQPAPNNCGLNMLCRVRTLIVTGSTSGTSATYSNTVSARVLDGGQGALDALTVRGVVSAITLDGGSLRGTTLNLSDSAVVGGSTALSKWPAGTVAVTGASVPATECANQGTAITTTGSAAGQPCIVGLPATPGNPLVYSCFTGTNTCQIVACNASDATPYSTLTGTYACRVMVP